MPHTNDGLHPETLTPGQTHDWSALAEGSSGQDRPDGGNGREVRIRAHMSELLGQGRPGPAWSVVTSSISPSRFSVESRRMCYPERPVIAALHVLDARPMPLMGMVLSCEYTGDGVHRVVVAMTAYQPRRSLELWLEEVGREFQRSAKRLRG